MLTIEYNNLSDASVLDGLRVSVRSEHAIGGCVCPLHHDWSLTLGNTLLVSLPAPPCVEALQIQKVHYSPGIDIDIPRQVYKVNHTAFLETKWYLGIQDKT